MLLKIDYTAENCGKWAQGNDPVVINKFINELIIGPSPEAEFTLEKDGVVLFNQGLDWDEFIKWVSDIFGVELMPESHEDTLRYYMMIYIMTTVIYKVVC